ncbi:hypothetical protein [Rubinisphaera sp. JC750]|uniref:hypothetical protein n=1 Tax=Rubinisphaera sp. JC750 TaxID=2898658 RepID=UPI001F3E9B51|nr:hypothetical protein [Rubinisphaera sp. JC750]
MIPLLLAALLFPSSVVEAEVPLLKPDELNSKASHIVAGQVQAVYETTETDGDWQSIDAVAEIRVSAVEKGTGIKPGGVVYARYSQRRWTGEGNPGPHSRGTDGVSQGEYVRAHLKQDAGVFEVLMPNGFVSIDQEEAPDNSTAEDAAARELAAVQGTWFRTVKTDQGEFTFMKEHAGHTTSLVITDAKGQLVEEKHSKFELSTDGPVRIFTFSDNIFVAGPNRGRVAPAPQSYIYRVVGDTFYEIRGLLKEDKDGINAFTWKRAKE